MFPVFPSITNWACPVTTATVGLNSRVDILRHPHKYLLNFEIEVMSFFRLHVVTRFNASHMLSFVSKASTQHGTPIWGERHIITLDYQARYVDASLKD